MNNFKKCSIILITLCGFLIGLSSPLQSKDCDLADIHEKMSYLRGKLCTYPPKLTHKMKKVVLRKYKSTINDLEKCLKEDPENVELHWRLGECYRLGHNLDLKEAWENSEKHLKKAISIDPKSIQAHIALGMLYVKTEPELVPEAEQLFKRVLELSGDKPLPAAHDGLFYSYYFQSKFEEAAAEAESCLSYYPNNQMYKDFLEFASCRADWLNCKVPLFPVMSGLRWGYVDIRGRIMIPLRFAFTHYFQDGLARVKIAGKHSEKWAYIDKSGKVVINPTFYLKEAYDFSEGLAKVQLGGKWGFMDRKGKIVIEPQFTDASSFSYGLARVKVVSKCGYIDTTGKVVIHPQFDEGRSFSGDLAAVKIGQKWGYIDTTGEKIINPQFDEASNFFEGIASVKVGKKYGFIDKTGKIVIEPQFDDTWSFSDGLAAVKISKKWGYIDTTGNLVIECKFDGVSTFSEGLAAVKVNKEWGYIDKTGRFIVKPKFFMTSGFYGGLAQVVVLEGWLKLGYIDKKGDYIWEPSL